MHHTITGLSPAPFAPLFALGGAELAARGARRVGADAAIRSMLADAGIACIDVRNAAPGCFAARVERA